MYYLETHSQDPCYNLALEETVLTRRTAGDYLMLWQNDNAVIIGRNQNAAEEIDADYVARHGVRVVRRMTGGGAVYHDLGNLNYSFITDAGDAQGAARFTEPVVSALRALGLDAQSSGRNDILVSGKKVSGTAQRLCKGRILHHGTLLFDSDGDMIARVLRPDAAKFDSKSVKSVRGRVGNIRAMLNRDMTLAEFWAYLKTALADELEPVALTEQELALAQTLAREKYAAWDWTYAAAPPSTATARRRFPGGTVEVRIRICGGKVEDIVFYGDFLALRDLTPVQEALRGLPCRRAVLYEALQGFALEEYFGTIRAEELLEVIPGWE